MTRQERDRQGWEAEKINRRRNLGRDKQEKEEEERMRETPRARSQAATRQTVRQEKQLKSDIQKKSKKP